MLQLLFLVTGLLNTYFVHYLIHAGKEEVGLSLNYMCVLLCLLLYHHHHLEYYTNNSTYYLPRLYYYAH